MAFVKLADNYTDLIGKFAVALLAEGVDRNMFQRERISGKICRPPRGGRG